MTIVVSDTSPIRALTHLDLLDLLEKLFGRCLVPEAVKAELLLPNQWIGPIDVDRLGFVEVKAPTDLSLLHSLQQSLDQGEAEALTLAIECGADVLLIDEAHGRSIARDHGLKVTGVLGILLAAKHQGEVGAIRPLIDVLQSEINFFISDAIRAYLLDQAGESET